MLGPLPHDGGDYRTNKTSLPVYSGPLNDNYHWFGGS